MRWACRSSDGLRVEVLGELARKELAGVVYMQLAYNSDWLRLADTRERVEFGDEGSNPLERLRLVLLRKYTCLKREWSSTSTRK